MAGYLSEHDRLWWWGKVHFFFIYIYYLNSKLYILLYIYIYYIYISYKEKITRGIQRVSYAFVAWILCFSPPRYRSRGAFDDSKPGAVNSSPVYGTFGADGGWSWLRIWDTLNDIDRDRTKVTKGRLGIRRLGILFDTHYPITESVDMWQLLVICSQVPRSLTAQKTTLQPPKQIESKDKHLEISLWETLLDARPLYATPIWRWVKPLVPSEHQNSW